MITFVRLLADSHIAVNSHIVLIYFSFASACICDIRNGFVVSS